MDRARVRFELYLRRRFGQASTAKHYISDLNTSIDTAGHKAPKSIIAEAIDSIVDHQIAMGLSPATINRRLASLHTFFEYLASEKPERDWPNPVVYRPHHPATANSLWSSGWCSGYSLSAAAYACYPVAESGHADPLTA